MPGAIRKAKELAQTNQAALFWQQFDIRQIPRFTANTAEEIGMIRRQGHILISGVGHRRHDYRRCRVIKARTKDFQAIAVEPGPRR